MSRYIDAQSSGEAVVLRTSAAAGQMPVEETLLALDGAQRSITCPRKTTAPHNHPMSCAYPGWPASTAGLPPCDNYRDAHAPPVDIRLSLLLVNNMALEGISREPLTVMGLRVKHGNYDKYTYESTATRIKRGCAENSSERAG